MIQYLTDHVAVRQDGQQVDLAVCLLGAFQHMLTSNDALRALRQANIALKPGGLFMLEMNHPMLLFDGSVVSSADTWTADNQDAQVCTLPAACSCLVHGAQHAGQGTCFVLLVLMDLLWYHHQSWSVYPQLLPHPSICRC
jgi:hypothetical protein